MIRKKGYCFNFHFSGHHGSAGSMMCEKCNKKVDSMTHDWVSYSFPTKHDWKYVTQHRDCTEDQSGWLKVERAKITFDNDVKKAIAIINTFKDDSGGYSSAFHTALSKLGVIE
jgi:hypothetical protein